ncbi:MAG: efflux RND transporter periplasmic adaptor subunit [Patescibacteria group bacterium]
MESILEESKNARKGVFGLIFKKKFLLVGLVVLILGCGFYYFYTQNKQTATTTTQQKKWTVKKEDLSISVSSTGKVVARDGVELSFPVSGSLEVSGVYVKEGDKILKGDKIAAVKTENLEFELRSAYSNYQSALANLNTKLAGATDSEINNAKVLIEQAEISLDQAKLSLEQTKITSAQSIANAETNLVTAEKNLNLNRNIGDSELVDNAYFALINTVKSISISLYRILHDSDSILGIDDTSVNDSFETVLGAKNISSLSSAQSSYVRAKSAKENLENYLIGLNDNDNGQIDLAAQKAQAALEEFQIHLYDMQIMLEATIIFSNFTQNQLDSFKSTISSNRSGVNSSSSSLANSMQSVSTAKNNLDQYQISYDKAVDDLKVTKSQSEQNISNANISVRSREIALEKAKADYNDLIAPPSTADLASARAQFTSASISVDKAKYNMEQATLSSPIDGVVSMLNYKAGDIILSDSAKTMATIINNDTLFIETNIEEADISKLKVGDKVKATFDAISGLSLMGEISFISLTSQTSANGIVTYLVRVMLENPGETQIREGMTVALDFITAEAKDVLSVPVAAVRNVGGNPSVEKIDGSFATVVTGFTDGKKVEIISGLEEGNVIVY